MILFLYVVTWMIQSPGCICLAIAGSEGQVKLCNVDEAFGLIIASAEDELRAKVFASDSGISNSFRLTSQSFAGCVCFWAEPGSRPLPFILGGL